MAFESSPLVEERTDEHSQSPGARCCTAQHLWRTAGRNLRHYPVLTYLISEDWGTERLTNSSKVTQPWV